MKFLILLTLLFSCAQSAQSDIRPRALSAERPYQWLEKSFIWDDFYNALKEIVDESHFIYEVSHIDTIEHYPLYIIDSKRSDFDPRFHIFISAGIHGNELLSVSVLLDFLKRYANKKEWQEKFRITVFPALNPWGLTNNKRQNSSNIDLNRTFTTPPSSRLSQTITSYLNLEDFDLVLDMHGAHKKKHFFIISHNPDETIAQKALAAIKLDDRLFSRSGSYPGKRGSYTMLAPGVATSHNLGTLKSWGQRVLQAEHSYTLEYPGQKDSTEARRYYLRIVESLIFHVYNEEN